MKTPRTQIVGRQKELEHLSKVIQLGRNLLIEGAVGVGKTFLVREALKMAKRDYERVDGDSRYTEQKLTGWFDPPLVLRKGYAASSFIEGPLVTAMKKGRVLFINELNRMPEAVQNILLPCMDERRLQLPKLGEIQAKAGFLVVATQNPREFTATHALSEALLDRFEMIHLAYQNRAEEIEIVRREIGDTVALRTLERTVDLIRSTRAHQSIKRGASIRAAVAVGRLLEGGLDFATACLMALPSRMETVSSEDDIRQVILDLIENNESGKAEKKKELER